MSINFPNSPIVGQLWPNPAQAGLPVYQWDGEKWLTTPISTGSVASFAQFEFTATAGQTTFSGLDIYGATLAYSAGYISVFVNGDRINKADFVGTNGTSIVFAIGRIVNDQVTIVALNTVPIANALMNSNNLSDLASIATARGNLGAVGAVKIQKFIASGTYTPSAGLLYAVIECIGAGASGGSTTATAGGQTSVSSGGGGGSYAMTVATKAAIGASQGVAIGAGGVPAAAGAAGNPGGTTSVGSLCSAGGGFGGVGGAAGNVVYTQGASGGSATIGDLLIVGQSSAPCFAVTSPSPNGAGSNGGSSGKSFGSGGIAQLNIPGNPGYGFGGGGGGNLIGAGTAAQGGGTGAAGIVFITEYCTQ